ncbi:MAG: ubiquinol oxidase subunit II [Simkaniaceae bacterium]|nr:ubiquinol oxidase subunit II [Simkaniaceae bacterium]
MDTSRKIIIIVCLCSAVTVALMMWFIRNHPVAVMTPKGMIALKERRLIIHASSLMLLIVVPTILLAFICAWRYREGNRKAVYSPDWEHNRLAECVWWGIPCIITLVLAFAAYETSHELSPFKAIESDKRAVRVQVVALNWKWLFLYPDHGVAAVNSLHLPVDTPITLEITADAPMNSFWIPQLGSQIYAMPAMRTELHLIANATGTYRGTSSNLSGKGFSGMFFTTEVSSETEFFDRIRSMKREGRPLDGTTYEHLTAPSEYDPPQFYTLTAPDLFDEIVRKYRPRKETHKR